MIVAHVAVSQLRLPLHKPYKVASCLIEDFRPMVVEVWDRDGRSGWGEAIITEGYAKETVAGGWDFCRTIAAELAGLETEAAKAKLRPYAREQSHAVSALVAAIESLEGHPALDIEAPVAVPLLEPVQAMDAGAIPAEVEHLLAQGFRTLKVKVGFNVDADLDRVALIQRINAGRASLRLDANQGFGRNEAIRFATSLHPDSIELLEQPCHEADWSANAAVAAVSTVPVMLDESIYDLQDIERAAGIDGVRFVKLKLKKLGGIEALTQGLARIRAVGLTPVLGDGVATEICCWMEACVARRTIDNAGEMNGFLKLKDTIVEEPLRFAEGSIHMAPGCVLRVDREKLRAYALAEESFSARTKVPPRG